MKTTRVLLCDQKTGCFVQSPDSWTRRAESAHDFQQMADALRFVREWQLSAVELVMSFEFPEYNVRVPVGGTVGRMRRRVG